MDHVVYLDAISKEMENLLDGSKSMLIRGATGRKMPYGRVNTGDTLYFLNNNAEGLVKLKGNVETVLNSDKMSKEESIALVQKYGAQLKLTDKQFHKWAGRRYIVLIGIRKIEEINPFKIDKSNYGNMDDWLPVENIENVKL